MYVEGGKDDDSLEGVVPFVIVSDFDSLDDRDEDVAPDVDEVGGGGCIFSHLKRVGCVFCG